MENYIQISKINDFIFCPLSLYFHSIYESFSEKTYHASPQVKGKIKHENIDKGEYSTAKRYLQGMAVASTDYGLVGKIDVFDTKTGFLIERKNKITVIYDGYKYQLYGQFLSLKGMGYHVKKMFLHSLSDNRRYEISLPNEDELVQFKVLLDKMRSFSLDKEYDSCVKTRNQKKCDNCIYNQLCL